MNTQETTVDIFNYSYNFVLTSQDTNNELEVTITGSAAENIIAINTGNEKEAWAMTENEKEKLDKRLKSMKISELQGDLLPELTVEIKER